MKELRCRDTGANCDAVMRGDSEQDVMDRALEHAQRVHHHDSFSEQERQEMRSQIHEA